jgi:MerR family transcriptional regulator, light-induced transcriptional regulator
MKSISDDGTAGDDPAVLSIGEVSRRTGIPVAGLRNWEQRYGLPRPERLANGRRRYRESDCLLLDEVLRGRAQGLSLAAAVAHALTGGGPFRDTSIFAGLRRRHPGLQVHVMTKTMLLAVTHAIEDECCARAQRPVLVGSFQRQRFYRQARPRWLDLARTAEQALVFADFGQRGPQSGPLPGPVAEIPVTEGSPLLREWALVCDAPDHPACLAAWERPGQEAQADPDRAFEMVWSVDPQVVRSAARIGAGLAAGAAFEIPAPLRARLDADAEASSADLRRASGLMERTFDYLSRRLSAAQHARTSRPPGPRP